MWEFENYVVHKEMDQLRFEDLEGEVLGYVSFDDGGAEVEKELNSGANPIEDGWEDGIGNTISLDGWGLSE